MVHVTHVESGPLPREAAGPQCGETSFVCQLSERVGLVHKLRKLGAAKELSNSGNNGPYVHQCAWCGLLRIVDSHPFLDHALHAHQSNAKLVLYELAYGPNAPVSQVVYVIYVLTAVVDLQHSAHNGDDVLPGQSSLV